MTNQARVEYMLRDSIGANVAFQQALMRYDGALFIFRNQREDSETATPEIDTASQEALSAALVALESTIDAHCAAHVAVALSAMETLAYTT